MSTEQECPKCGYAGCVIIVVSVCTYTHGDEKRMYLGATVECEKCEHVYNVQEELLDIDVSYAEKQRLF